MAQFQAHFVIAWKTAVTKDAWAYYFDFISCIKRFLWTFCGIGSVLFYTILDVDFSSAAFLIYGVLAA